MSDTREPGSKSKPSGAMISDFGRKDDKAKAALDAFGQQLATLDLDGDIEVGLRDEVTSAPSPASDVALGGESSGPAEFELEPEPALELAIDHGSPNSTPSPGLVIDHATRPAPPSPELQLRLDTDRPNLEPVGDDAHPPQNRRAPTQPPGVVQLAIDESPAPAHPAPPRPDAGVQQAAPHVPVSRGPSPSPSPSGRRWLFSDDRVTNIMAGAAIGLALTIIPAKKLARGYEVREVEPMIADLEGAIEHPLGVEAGLVERPESIAAKIDAGRKATRRRYLGIWLLAGLPIGLGLGLAPRPD